MGNYQRTDWKRPLPLPKHVTPLVLDFFKLLNAKKMTIAEVAELSGVGRGTISEWRYSRTPRIDNLVAAFNALGYNLIIVAKR